MTQRGSRPLRRRALRTATISMAAVGLLLLVLLTATDLLVARNLTAGVDDRLRDQLTRAEAAPPAVIADSGVEGDFAEPVLRWTIDAHSAVTTESGSPSLPASLAGTTGFVSATIAGTQFRLTGAALPDGRHLVVAASVQSVSHATATLLISELILGPVLLAAVFGGSFLIGRRVADPIEAMRQRQLDFTADASHELRTPLTVIQVETSLLGEDATGETRASLQRISGETDRMRRIVEDLLWLARFDNEPRAPTSEAVDLTTLAAGAIERFRTMAASRALDLQLSAPADESVVVELPPEWLDRLAGVLIDNACRYSRRGGAVVVAVTAAGGRPRLAVRDSGPGVPADERQRIFTRFHRGTTEGDGAGLGLAIADAVVQSTEGRWEISSPPAGGAEFAVSWRRPRRPAAVAGPVLAPAASA
ncbi:MAG: HAMP domain-containing histidine kinase [Candidatus Dormibacteraeota bacterium]|nr:HAMP domain-containing histidine kinase [Candidatus Dormibacteraeota bacterium]